MSEVIGAKHEFHDQSFVAEWAERFVPTPERIQLFEVISAELKALIPAAGRIVELGVGPGYLADYLLRAMSGIQYCAVDFSAPMLHIAGRRLKPHSGRVSYVQADLLEADWWADLPGPVDAVVSTWALHDLGSQENVESVYRRSAELLRDGGVLLNGDFIKPDQAVFEYEPGRFEIARHLELLRRVGFGDAQCLVVLEKELEAPTAAQNYACFRGLVTRNDRRSDRRR